MIGVIAKLEDHDVVREFFELFKTPWEFYQPHRSYDVLLVTRDVPVKLEARIIVFYAGEKREFDGKHQFPVGRPRNRSCVLTYGSHQIPIYGESVAFFVEADDRPERAEHSEAAYARKTEGQILVRVGYDLFSEFRYLLTVGQPPSNAPIPTADLHIALLRDLITANGVPLAEIPPVPEGFNFVVCLTHDVDHPSLLRHRFDHTTCGLLYRGGPGSCWNFIRGRMSLRQLLKNWAAILSLPFVHIGIAKDFWRNFGDRYLEIERGFPSTFFIIPFSNYPGRTRTASAPRFRAARYRASELSDVVHMLTAAGCEVGLHGIDAWLASTDALKELDEIRRLTSVQECGVRMHWLYFDQGSPNALDLAGASYDSTVGYNGTVGYRAGTSQVYRPLNSNRMLELPMHAMDTALLYPGYLHLSSREAKKVIGHLADNATQFGGALTINWHDRSLAPERQWDSCYRDMFEDLKSRGAWFATAGQAVSWFRKRRAAIFAAEDADPRTVRASVLHADKSRLPRLRLRVHGRSDGVQRKGMPRSYSDFPITEVFDTAACCEVHQ
ncbi:MAG: hypothetical protein ACRD5K_06725 [Candidatus Acidiferrales bacterium]